MNLNNSNRLQSLKQAGRIYLSLQDAIALAVENNLDIASQRYVPLIAGADLKRAQSGGLTRGIPENVTSGPSSSAQISVNPIVTTAASTASQTTTATTATTTTGRSNPPPNATSAGSSSPGSPFLLNQTASSATTSTSVQGSQGTSQGVASSTSSGLSQLGPTVPSLDPVVRGSVSWGHITLPQASPYQAGTTALVTQSTQNSLALSKNFITGGSAVLTLSNALVSQNSGLNNVNPFRSATLDLTVLQPLLQGFSPSVNRRYLSIAKNEVKLADLVFRQQVISTVSNVVKLYWDLVSFNDAVKYCQQNLAVSEKTYNDNKKQVDIGTLAPIEITRAEAEVAARKQDLTIAETNVLQQETILKNVLSRNGAIDPLLAVARIVPTDSIQIPKTEDAADFSVLSREALANRLELMQSGVSVENSKIQLHGTKAELLPQLGFFMELTNHGLSGFANTIPPPEGFPVPSPDAYFIGGMANAFAQVFRRNFPDYRFGITLNIPFRNRAAQSDYVHDQLTLRQAEIGYRQNQNQILVDVQNALIGLKQSRAQYDAALKQMSLQEETLDAELKKNGLGANTLFDVIQAQRDLVQAQSNEVTAESAYVKARVNFEVATGRILSDYQINVEEARQGIVSRPPSALPPEEKP